MLRRVTIQTSCLFLNKSPVSSATGENITKLDSFDRKEEIQSSGNNLFTSHSVCRLCMKSINTEFHNYLSDNRSDLTLNMQLQKYFPELVIKTSQDLSICTLCKISLEAYFDTMPKNWSYAEENDESHDVINETPKSHNDFNLGNEEKIKLYEYSVGTDVPSVTALGIPELSIKCEEVDIKMEGYSKRFAEDGTRIYQRNLDGASIEKNSIEGQCKLTENANSKNG
ncbi:hypothetical protein NQ318_001852 [Aromia moschata]|uniref:ZAD domain-containing protein n=1 Tax=Aromia moschata TaxID=1265417 RepID=A0AAV8Z3Z1_9CUCU|nr:hypothetical protein NQ318_001852 [Aromia moschata]